MRWISDSTGRFKERPFYEDLEIDNECEDMIDACLEQRNKSPFVPPLDTDTLNVLLETYAGDVDLYADLVQREGPGVEGMTEFRKGKAPRIFIDKKLSERDGFSNRLRSTMAHELFHARFHRVLWELHWSGQGGDVRCQEHMLFSSQTDWYEWQAAYGSGAILVPRSAVRRILGSASQVEESSLEGRALVGRISSSFLVSAEAARVRLVQLNYLTSRARALVLGA